jgi:hypothetical protein
MSAQMNVASTKVEEIITSQEINDHILRLRNGTMYEIGGCLADDSALTAVAHELMKDHFRVVFMSVYPKDKTLVRGTTEPIRFNMFMENFHDEEFGKKIGGLVALRIWDDWRNTHKWFNRHYIETTYLELAEAIFGKKLIAKMAKEEAKKAVEIMKQQALEWRQAKEAEEEEKKKGQEAEAKKNADELTQRLKDEEDARNKQDYLAYNDFSGIVGVISRKLGFKYGSDGFFKIFVDKKGQYRDILITKNLRDAQKILGFRNVDTNFSNIKSEDDIVEDSAGTFELEIDWTGKDIKGKRVTLKKGTRLKHERSGGFGQDYMKAGSIMIDADEIGRDYLSAPY